MKWTILFIQLVVVILLSCANPCCSNDRDTTNIPCCANVSFERSAYGVDEDNGPAQPVLVLSNPLSTDIIVQVNATDGSATGGGVDYDSGPYNITFQAGTTSVPFNVLITDDDILEDNENFLLTVDLSLLPDNITASDPYQVTVTIVDKDVITVMFGQSVYTVNENDDPAQAVLVLSNPSSIDITVEVYNTDGSAIGEGIDYDSGPYAVTFPALVTSVPFKVSLNDDDILEENETFILTINQSSLPSGVTVSNPSVTTVNIVDNDPTTVMFNQSMYNVDEDDGPAWLVLVLSNPSSSDITVQVITEDGSATGGGVDYISGPYTVTFPAGVTIASFDVPINDDNILEGNEIFKFTIDLSSLPSDVTAGNPLQATMTVADDDHVTVMLSRSSYSVHENTGVVKPVVVLSNPSSVDITIQVSDIQGGATGNDDYTPGPYTVTFPAGVTSATFDVTIVGDSIIESDERFLLAINQSSLPSHIIRGSPGTATVIIVDDDTATVFFKQPLYSVDEGDTTVNLVLVLSNPSVTNITIQMFNIDGSATGGRVDYGSGPYEVTFTAGTTEASFNVSLTDDNIFENNENFMITIDPSSLPNNVTVGDRKRVTVIIMDNDAPTVSFDYQTYNVDEYDGPAILTLTLSNPPSTAVTIEIFSTDGSATGGDTDYGSGVFSSNLVSISKRDNGDYTAGPYSVTFKVDTTTALLSVPINDDDTFEGNENFTLTIDSSSLPSGVIVSNPGYATVTIIENDAVTVSFDRSSYRINENHGLSQHILVLSNPSSTDITVQVMDSNNTAIGGGVDYSSGPYVVTFPAGVTRVSFAVVVTNDNVLEGDEKFNLVIDPSSLPTSVTVSDPTQATVTIYDDDDIILRFNQTTYRINENDGSFQPVLVLSNPSLTDVTIQVIDNEVSATGNTTGGGDYIPGPYNITIPAGHTNVSFNISITDNNVVERDKIFNLAIAPKSLPYLLSRGNPGVAIVSIVNDDVTTVEFEQSTYSVHEYEGSVQPAMVFSNPLSYNITVQVLGLGKNSTSRQYNVTLSAGTTHTSFSVPIINDDLLEYNEEFDLFINQSSLPFNVNVGDIYQTTVMIVDDDDGCTTRRHYFLGFFQNDNGESLDLSILISTTELWPVSYSVYFRYTGSRYSGTVTANNSAVVYLSTSAQVTSYNQYYHGIHVETSSNKVTVIGRSYTTHTTDTYLALPVIRSQTVSEYIYYAMSFYSPNSYCVILIVGTEDNTAVTLRFSSYLYVYVEGFRYVYYYSFTVNKLRTVYIYPNSASYDLSGTKITANKPISVFTGHRAAYVPYSYGNYGYLIEQIPSTIYWGKVHYIAPLAARRIYILKVVTAHYNTRIIIYCNNSVHYSTTQNERDYFYTNLGNQEYCAVHSNNDIMVAQFSGRYGEDPSMGLVPATNNYASRFQIPVTPFRYAADSLYTQSFINIIVMAQFYQPDKIYLIRDGVKMSLIKQIWTPIAVNDVVEAYATKVPVLPGVVEIIHTDEEALMTTMVYGIDQRIGYIHPGGLLHNLLGRPSVFLSQPPSYSVNVTETANITCSAIGYNVTYEWIIESGSFPNKVIDTNSSTLVIPNVTSSDENTYTCVVTTKRGCVSSSATQLTVTGFPTIILTPSSQSVEVTLTATFTAKANGTGPFTYQWQKGNKILHKETGTTYTVNNASEEDQSHYRCRVFNVYGNSAVSDRVWLKVTRNPPNITENPTSKLVGLESNFTNTSLTCKADGASSYSWEKQDDFIPSSAIGVNTNTLTLINLQLRDAGRYRCIATNDSGSTESDYATLTVKAVSSTIVTHPTDTTATAPYSAVFTCSIYGYGYQNITWHRESDKLPYNHQINEVSSPTIITSTLTIPNVTEQDVGKYYCQVWANNMRTQSHQANLYYAGLPVKPTVEMIPGQSINLTVNDFRLSMDCIPRGDNYEYKWEKKKETTIPRSQGANSTHLIINDLRPADSGEYRCIVSNFTGIIASDYSLLTVEVALPVITRQPRSTTVRVFSTGSLKCTAISYGAVSLTWKKFNSELPVTADITVSRGLNEITSVLRLESVGYYKGYYYCVVENSAGIVNSTFAHFDIIVPCPEMVLHPIPTKVRLGKTVTFSCVAWSYGGLTYEWNKNDSLTLPNNSAVSYESRPLKTNNAINTTVYEITLFNVQETNEGHYCCIASNGCGSTTECAWLEVDTSPTIILQPVSHVFKRNERDVLVFEIVATTIGNINYLWLKYDSYSDNWIPVSSRAVNDTSATLNFKVITEEDQGIYHCIVTNHDGSVASDNVTITVYGPPHITYYSGEMVVYEGNRVDMMCNATNDADANIPVQISWYNGTELIKLREQHVVVNNVRNNVTGQVHSVLSIYPVNYTNDGDYACRAFNHPLSYTESKIKLTVEYAPRVSIYPHGSNYTVNIDTKLFLYCTANGLPTPTIQWYENNVPIPDQTSSLYTVPTNTSHVTLYSCEAKNNAGNMENTAYANITVIVQRNNCVSLKDPDNGTVYQFPDGTTAIFSCKNGFITKGESILRCVNGNWSSLPPKCVQP